MFRMWTDAERSRSSLGVGVTYCIRSYCLDGETATATKSGETRPGHPSHVTEAARSEPLSLRQLRLFARP